LLGRRAGYAVSLRENLTPEEWTSPQRNRLRPREIGYAFHGVNISQGKYSTGRGKKVERVHS